MQVFFLLLLLKVIIKSLFPPQAWLTSQDLVYIFWLFINVFLFPEAKISSKMFLMSLFLTWYWLKQVHYHSPQGLTHLSGTEIWTNNTCPPWTLLEKRAQEDLLLRRKPKCDILCHSVHDHRQYSSQVLPNPAIHQPTATACSSQRNWVWDRCDQSSSRDFLGSPSQ